QFWSAASLIALQLRSPSTVVFISPTGIFTDIVVFDKDIVAVSSWTQWLCHQGLQIELSFLVFPSSKDSLR
ncbi:hypothetical protein M405DRAFT_814947, partial [Rhizopogon salebrosus TDB-379]